MKPESDFDSLWERLQRNKDRLEHMREAPLVDAQPTKKSPGVYLLFFEGKLQYIGSAGNLFARIRNNLINGNRDSHTLVNKLCILRGLKTDEARTWLRQNAKITVMATDSEDDARLLEDVMIALKHPYFNTPLRQLRHEPSPKDFQEKISPLRRLDEWTEREVRPSRRGKE
ncbi:hypothetical protein MUP77_11505 [Candidatus Bathyarchaeota archaeon]|nr:hypothetical protein [Candidatus Bathyarchaeota archaeon]